MVEEIVEKIEERGGIDVYKYHAEEPWEGMYEIVLQLLSATQAADALVYCYEAIKGIAKQHCLHATMHTKPFEVGGPNIGAHTHFSISNVDKGREQAFLTGVIENYPAITGFANPLMSSASRYTGKHDWVTWGYLNKRCTIRQWEARHWEFRGPDGTMNPYLMLAALITAGLDGMRRDLALIAKSIEVWKGQFTEEEREEYGLTTKMPKSLTESLDSLEDNDLMKSERGFGEEFIKGYICA